MDGDSQGLVFAELGSRCRMTPNVVRYHESLRGPSTTWNTMESDIHGVEQAAGGVNRRFVILVIVIKTSDLLDEG
jgi:hypothetical protein